MHTLITSDLTLREDSPKVPERALAAVWARADSIPDGLVTEDGRHYRVIYPGRLNSREGPDFLDAVFITDDGERIAGDVELHIDSRGWYGHRHHEDPNYNGVVLHVVLHTKADAVTRGRSGINVPIVSLSAEAVGPESALDSAL